MMNNDENLIDRWTKIFYWSTLYYKVNYEQKEINLKMALKDYFEKLRKPETLYQQAAVVALASALILLIPVALMQTTDEETWSVSDYIIMWVLLSGCGIAYKMITAKKEDWIFRAAAALAVLTSFLLIWVNLAAGLIGGKGNPANMMFIIVITTQFISVLLSNFKSGGLANAMFVTAAVQASVPFIALILGKPHEAHGITGVIGANLFFALLYASAGLLFKYGTELNLKLNLKENKINKG